MGDLFSQKQRTEIPSQRLTCVFVRMVLTAIILWMYRFNIKHYKSGEKRDFSYLDYSTCSNTVATAIYKFVNVPFVIQLIILPRLKLKDGVNIR